MNHIIEQQLEEMIDLLHQRIRVTNTLIVVLAFVGMLNLVSLAVLILK